MVREVVEGMEVVRIVPFDDAYAAEFARLNYAWIDEYFIVEDKDRFLLDHPVENIIECGGQIFFALADETVVGTVALIPDGHARYELAKMSVAPEFRGRGIGDRLMDSCIRYSREKGKKSIFLLSNTKLKPAINLYKKYGFVQAFHDARSHYERVNIVMELALEQRNR